MMVFIRKGSHLFLSLYKKVKDINEAVELAKKYGSEDSGAFVNGILDNIHLTVHKKQTPAVTVTADHTMSTKYDSKMIERKWQSFWEEKGLFWAKEDPSRAKYYVLEMFPYPSGKIHMGHVRNYTIGDVVARYKMMRGYNVLHPMGWDSLGMPAENAAIRHKTHPKSWTMKNIDYMRKQIKRMGFGYDWEREVTTCLPEYYRWNQWFFLKMMERGLALPPAPALYPLEENRRRPKENPWMKSGRDGRPLPCQN